jgi:aspartyl aminopeptidase
MHTRWDIDQFIEILSESKTPYTVVAYCIKKLAEHGFLPMQENTALLPGAGYYYQLDGATLVAWRMPNELSDATKTSLTPSIRILAAHTDSPCLKLKPNALFKRHFDGGNYYYLATEPYGSPILSSWYNRTLDLEGRVWFQSTDGSIISEDIKWPKVGIIPAPSKHLMKELTAPNPQEEMNLFLGSSLGSLAAEEEEGKIGENSFSKALSLHVQSKLLKEQGQLLGYDLLCVASERAQRCGADGNHIVSQRLDNLASAYAILEALLLAKPQRNILQIAALFDHEEIGSETVRGADSPLLEELLKRIFGVGQLGVPHDPYQRIVLSVDVAHGLHPNHVALADERHRCLVGSGAVIKQHANYRYASEAQGIAWMQKLVLKQPSLKSLQRYCHRNDMACGSTIGPVVASRLMATTVDLGMPLFSMHSCSEVAHWNDYHHLRELLLAALTFS